MPATSFYADAAYEHQQLSDPFEPDLTSSEAELLVDDIFDLDEESYRRC